MKLRLLIALAVLTAASAAVAGATPLFMANLDGAQETPPVNTPAQGFSTVMLDENGNLITVSLLFGGLTTPETVAHIHGPAPRGKAAPPFLTLPLGSFLNWQANITSQQKGWIESGLTYVNVHSEQHPGGEIRGQLEAVPEPATVALLGAGLIALGLARRKRRA